MAGTVTNVHVRQRQWAAAVVSQGTPCRPDDNNDNAVPHHPPGNKGTAKDAANFRGGAQANVLRGNVQLLHGFVQKPIISNRAVSRRSGRLFVRVILRHLRTAKLRRCSKPGRPQRNCVTSLQQPCCGPTNDPRPRPWTCGTFLSGNPGCPCCGPVEPHVEAISHAPMGAIHSGSRQ